jgi:DNA-directed RNA polymerase subunit RPC12/RpoP
MAKYVCRECGKKELKIMGTGYYKDTIEVECQACGEFYEVEPDGLGQGGLELIIAMEIDSEL